MGRPHPDRLGAVVVAHDGSPGALRAARRVTLLPLRPDAALHFVSVSTDDARRGDDDARLRAHAAAARDALERAGRTDVQVLHAGVEAPRAAEGLIRYARVQGADLLVVGRHGQDRPGEPSMGSTVLHLLREADLPLLVVVAEAAANPYARPVVAIDLSDASRQVVELALALLPEPPPTLSIVHALHVPFEGALSWGAAPGGAAALREDAAREARSRVERFVESLRPLAASADVAVAEGETSLAVMREAVRRAADLVLVGTHARSGLSHAIFGSVAEWIVAAAPCDVAVTRPTRRTFELP